MKKIITTFFVALFAASTIFAAGVKRGGNADLSIYLNSSDTDRVSEDLVSQIVASPRISKFEDKNGRLAIVTIGKIKDETGEFFDTQILANSLKSAILKKGDVLEFMANKDVRDAMRNEVASQAEHSREDVAKEMDAEDAADYMLTGSVKLMVQTSGKKQERSYSVNIELADLQTHRTVGMFEPSDSVKKYLRKEGKIKSR